MVKPLEDDEDEGLDEEELSILREAGIVAEPGKKKRRRKSNKGHILFAVTEDQGESATSSMPIISSERNDLARELAVNKKSVVTQDNDMDMEEEWEDLGWKTDESAHKKDVKGKGKATSDSLEALEEQRKSEASVRSTFIIARRCSDSFASKIARGYSRSCLLVCTATLSFVTLNGS